MAEEKDEGEGTGPSSGEGATAAAGESSESESSDAEESAKSDAADEAPEESGPASEKEAAAPASEKEAAAPPPKAKEPAAQPAAWGEPFARLEKKWTRVEVWLCAVVLLVEIGSLCLWIALKGLSAEHGGGDQSGLVFRGLLGATVLGIAAHRLARPKEEPKGEEAKKQAATRHSLIVGAAIAAGIFGAWGWVNRGTEYTSNLLNWMQTASALTLVGGLRGIATRLTLWLALLGASLATASGKHINIDVVMRFLPVRMRVPVAVIGWVVGSVVCTAGVWGFFDHIAIENFHVPALAPCAGDASKSCDVPPGEKIAKVREEVGKDWFLLGRQMSLDWMSFPKVLRGEAYNGYLHASEWNAWLDAGDWKAHYPAEDVDALRMGPSTPPGEARLPMISIPGSSENIPGLLTRELNFIFPLGLLAIALRFLLRSLLAISGHVKVDPDSAHGEAEVDEAMHEHEHEGPLAEGGEATP